MASSEEDEIVVLSPFEVACSNDSDFLKSTRPAKRAKRPDPQATGPGSADYAVAASRFEEKAKDSRDVLPEELARVKQVIDGALATIEEPKTRSNDQPLPRPAQKPAAPPPPQRRCW